MKRIGPRTEPCGTSQVRGDEGKLCGGISTVDVRDDSFLPLITRPARFTTTTATLIDNIMRNAFNDDLISGILIADVSDHLPVFAIIGNATIVESNAHLFNKPKAARVINDANMKQLSDKLSDVPWNDVLKATDINECYDSFSNIFGKLYDACLPLDVAGAKRQTLRKPWITKCILVSINKKYRFYRDSLKMKTPHSTVKFKEYRNK